jgi:hypothetical protein
MPKIINSKTFEGIEIVTIVNEDGTTWSGLKSAYDEQQAEAKAPKVVDEATPV